MRRKTTSTGLAAGLLAIAALAAMIPTDVLACGIGWKTLSAAERARQEEQFQAHRKALQARNIQAIEKVLAKTEISALDRTKVKELRDEAARLRDAGKLSDADRVLRAAFKMLGHPELFVYPVRPHC